MNEINYKKTEENDDKESKKKKFFSKLLSFLINHLTHVHSMVRINWVQ